MNHEIHRCQSPALEFSFKSVAWRDFLLLRAALARALIPLAPTFDQGKSTSQQMQILIRLPCRRKSWRRMG